MHMRQRASSQTQAATSYLQTASVMRTTSLRQQENIPDVQFCHATGTKAHTEELDNFHNAFASIYEGRYLAGIAAGMKLNEMIDSGERSLQIEAKMGYVGAYTYAEVISGYTSFFLGARSVCPRLLPWK